MAISKAAERARRLAEDPIPRLLFRLSLPAVIGMVTAGVYNFVDSVLVGRAVGIDGLTGVGVALPYMLLLVALGMLVGFGAATQISIHLGEKKHDEAERVLGSAALMLIVQSVTLTVIGLLLFKPYLGLLQLSDNVHFHAERFLQIIIFATAFQLVAYGLSSAIRAEGNTRTATMTMLIGVVMNLGLASLFLFVFRWGLRGAALATAIAQGVSASWIILYFIRGKSLLRLRWKNLRFDGPRWARILVVGSPMFARQVATLLTYSFMMYQLGAYGQESVYGKDLATAAWVTVYRFLMLFAFAVFGVNQGTQPIIGFNFGARRFDRVKQALLTGIVYASALAAAGFLAAMLFPQYVLSVFVDSRSVSHDELVKLGTYAMRMCFLCAPLLGFQVIGASYFQAVRKPLMGLFLMLSRDLLILLPLLWILPRFFQLDGVWMAWPGTDLLSSLLTGVCLLYELRRLDRQHEETLAPVPQESLPTSASLAEDMA